MELTKVCTVASITTLFSSSQLTFLKGTTFRENIVIKDSNGDPIDLTDNEVTLYLVKVDGTEIFNIGTDLPATTYNSIITKSDAVNGEVEILITDEETFNMDFSSGKWWISLNLLNGDILYKENGSIIVKEPWE